METEISKDCIIHLVECLHEEIHLYQSLYDIVLNEKELIITVNVEELLESNKLKDALVVKLKSMERVRGEIVKKIFQQVSLNKNKVSFQSLIDALPEPHSSKLKEIKDILLLLVERVMEQNKANANLVQTALGTVQGALGSLKSGLNQNKVYKKEGAIKQSPLESGHLVRKEV